MLTQSREKASPRRIRVLIADDHALFAEAVNLLLATDEWIEFVGHAPDGVAAVDLALEVSPDVVLMDIHMPNGDGFDATRRLRRLLPRVAIVMLTSSKAPEDIAQAREAGACGYVTKDADPVELRAAIHQACTPRRRSAPRFRPEAALTRRLKARRPFLAFAGPA
jgi:DNA-binding NarL/FixJ family response regulator